MNQLKGFSDRHQSVSAAKDSDRVAAFLQGAAIVVVGTSIPGLVLAERLSRVRPVLLVTGQPPLAKRLVNGCSLRRSTSQVPAKSFDEDVDRFSEALGGAAASFTQLSLFKADSNGAG